jgi:hypothetical protein
MRKREARDLTRVRAASHWDIDNTLTDELRRSQSRNIFPMCCWGEFWNQGRQVPAVAPATMAIKLNRSLLKIRCPVAAKKQYAAESVTTHIRRPKRWPYASGA